MRRLEETYAEQVDFHILNVDLLSTRELALQYGVSAIPNIVLLDAAGNLVQQMVGYQEENQLIEAVENLLEASNYRICFVQSIAGGIVLSGFFVCCGQAFVLFR